MDFFLDTFSTTPSSLLITFIKYAKMRNMHFAMTLYTTKFVELIHNKIIFDK